ncbi:CUB and sushi domain-containing protein 3 [Takifugu flavidus]|uniref:CUB and sushi domain-containing protein 3 n=1 Tax=Takifugu flavidus TaxID=433684 RepID=A0A5C6NCS4_9TELE|nr:CUB and sushi domain-containing protein 3 [Takifugu flavidus]
MCAEELHSTSCGNPGVPPKAVLSGSGRFAVGDQVQYSCVPGYVLDGHATLTCITNAGNTAVWDFPAPICRVVYLMNATESVIQRNTLPTECTYAPLPIRVRNIHRPPRRAGGFTKWKLVHVHSEVMCCELSDGREGLTKEKRRKMLG